VRSADSTDRRSLGAFADPGDWLDRKATANRGSLLVRPLSLCAGDLGMVTTLGASAFQQLSADDLPNDLDARLDLVVGGEGEGKAKLVGSAAVGVTGRAG